MNSYFKNGELNRDPRKPSPVKLFFHPPKYRYNPTIKKSPEQLKEAKK
jgi:hypothetical protein